MDRTNQPHPNMSNTPDTQDFIGATYEGGGEHILKIGSLNTQGLLSAGKLEALCQWGIDKEYDIIALQETNMN